jgi:Ca-activated chloride channel family protein
MSIGFEYPQFIITGIVLIPLAALLIFKRTRNCFALLAPLGVPGGVPFKPPFKWDLILKILFAMEMFAVFLFFLAAAGPERRTNQIVWLNRGADILFVLDISPSMAGIDMEGRSRFDTARSLVREFAEKRPSDAIGLAAVGNDAALLVPPTVDRRPLIERLARLRVAELGDGTALGMGLAVAARHLQNSAAPRRAVVLVTDGENNAGAVNPETAAALLAELGISLWVIGVGSVGVIPIDYVDPATRMRRTGTFDSRFDTESLRALSQAGDGVYIAATSVDTFAAAFSRISGEELTVNRSGTFIRRRSLYVPLILGGLGLIALVRSIRRFLLGAWI